MVWGGNILQRIDRCFNVRDGALWNGLRNGFVTNRGFCQGARLLLRGLGLEHGGHFVKPPPPAEGLFRCRLLSFLFRVSKRFLLRLSFLVSL